MTDVDDILAREANQVTRDKEIDRILQAFQLDAYSVLDLLPGCSEKDVTVQYRKKSLLIHPDKSHNPQAPDAFDVLKKAQAILADPKKRERLDQTFVDARRLLIRDRRWTIHDERLKSPEFIRDWREATKNLLIEDEQRRARMLKVQMEEEGRQKRMQEEQQELQRRSKEAHKAWEDTRDIRVQGWRDYRHKVEKKKRKREVLG